MTALTCKICNRDLEIPTGAREVQRRFGIVTYLFPNREAHVFRIVKETVPAPAIKPVAPIKPTVAIVPVPVLEQPKQPQSKKPEPDKLDRFGATLADAFKNFKK